MTIITLSRRFAIWSLVVLGLIITACSATATPTQSSSSEPTVPTAATETTASAETSIPPTAETTASVGASIPPIPNTIDLESVPQVDRSNHTVPLEEIYFDTFRRVNRVVPLSEADDALIIKLRDAIPPIYNPKFETAAEAEAWLEDSDLVVGYADGDTAYAYPIKIMNWHEMVSHDINGKPILATY